MICTVLCAYYGEVSLGSGQREKSVNLFQPLAFLFSLGFGAGIGCMLGLVLDILLMLYVLFPLLSAVGWPGQIFAAIAYLGIGTYASLCWIYWIFLAK